MIRSVGADFVPRMRKLQLFMTCPGFPATDPSNGWNSIAI
jgi:hypothetical protein